MKCLLICQVRDYNISDFVSEFESMGIDVSVNLNAFNFASLGNKRVREVGGLSVVTFSTNFTSRVTSLLNVSWILREPSLVS